jgi:hypothetical protein
MPTNVQAILEDIDRTLHEAKNISTTRSDEDIARACLMLSSAIARYAPPNAEIS